MPTTDHAETSTRKADFSSIYDRSTPDDCFGTLTPLDYQIPQQALPVLQRVIGAASATSGPAPVLDVCCSYAINAALLRCKLEV